MRWERLFADLEAQLDAADQADLEGEVRDRSRSEAARLRLVDRLRAAVGHPVTVHTLGAGSVRGVLVDVGPDWLLLADRPAADVLVPAAAVLSVAGLGTRSAEPGVESPVASRLGLTSALRAIARDRAPVSVVLVDGAVVGGTLDRVGADFVEVAEHPPGEARRAAAVRSVRTVPFGAIGAVRAG